MPRLSFCRFVALLTFLLVFCLTTIAQSTLYEASLIIRSNGKPALRMTNRYRTDISAFVFTVNMNGGPTSAEYRLYYDAVVDWPLADFIAPTKSAIVPVGYVVGSDISKLAPQVRAVVFKDGTTVGDSAWTGAILQRRQRSHLIIQRITGLLQNRIAIASAYDDTLNDLAGAQETVRQEPLDEFRLVDERQLRDAIVAIDAAKTHGRQISATLSSYINRLRQQLRKLETSGSSWDNSGGHRNSPPPPSWGETGETITTVVSHSMGLERRALPSHFTPAVLRMSNEKFSLLGVPRLKPVTVWTCYYQPPLGKDIVYADGCDNTNTTRDIHFGIGAYDPITDTRVVYQYDIGEYVAYGACWTYTDCDGNYHSDERIGDAQQFGPEQWGNSVRFAAILDAWQPPPFSSCSCSDPNPDGLSAGSPSSPNSSITPIVYLLQEQTGFCSPSP